MENGKKVYLNKSISINEILRHCNRVIRYEILCAAETLITKGEKLIQLPNIKVHIEKDIKTALRKIVGPRKKVEKNKSNYQLYLKYDSPMDDTIEDTSREKARIGTDKHHPRATSRKKMVWYKHAMVQTVQT